MDPYLEGSLWTTVHNNLIEGIGRQLAPRLRPKYLVRTVRCFVMDWPEELTISTQGRYPDVSLVATHEPAPAYAAETTVASSPPLQIPTLIAEKVPVTSLEIRDSDITDVWPLQLDSPLPIIPVPLLPEDDDITLDLQSALTTIYDLYSYDLSTDYSQPPQPTLTNEDAQWAKQLLLKAGLIHST